MGLRTFQYERYQEAVGLQNEVPFITTGTIVDMNDPMQQGRMRVVVPRYGDLFHSPLEDIPWTLYCPPSVGTRSIGTRGPGVQISEGPVAYGFWSPPTVGATALVSCIDGDPNYRVFLGCIPSPHTLHTMPHGRWIHGDHPELPEGGLGMTGPLTSREQPIQPLYDNINEAFGDEFDAPQRMTRAADYSVSSVSNDALNSAVSKVADDRDYTTEDWTQTNGYGLSRVDPNAPATATDRNMDNVVHSWTTPGHHSISMDDRQENCRVKIRTTSGKQILLDDTNERIYISTGRGKIWLEFDELGFADMYFDNGLNIHSKGHINLYAGKDISLFATENINMTALKDFNINVGEQLNIIAKKDVNLLGGEKVLVKGNEEVGISSAEAINISSGDMMNLGSKAQILQTAGAIHLNGPVAKTATAPKPKIAKLPTRIPQHEPWVRSDIKQDEDAEKMEEDDEIKDVIDPEEDIESEFEVDDPEAGRVINGIVHARGYYWRQ